MNEDKTGLSPREILTLAMSYWNDLRKRWYIPLIFSVSLGGYYAWDAFQNPLTYTSKLSFMLNEEKTSKGLASLLGPIAGLAGPSGGYQLEKILELTASRRILGDALFVRIELEGVNDYYANHLIRSEKLHEQWQGNPLLENFTFQHHNRDSFSRAENLALQSLHLLLIGSPEKKGLISTDINEDAGIMYLRLKTQSESVSIEFLKEVYNQLSNFYVLKSVAREQETLNLLAQKRDSLYRALTRNDRVSAQFDDKMNALVFNNDRVPTKQYKRNDQVLTLAYGEAIKNAELAEFALQSSTPFLTLIDHPIPPIKPMRPGRLKSTLTGLLIGLGLGVAFVVGRKYAYDWVAANL